MLVSGVCCFGFYSRFRSLWLAWFSFFRLLMLAMLSRSLSLVGLVAAVRVYEGYVVEVSCKLGFEVEFSVSFCCSLSTSSALGVLVLRGRNRLIFDCLLGSWYLVDTKALSFSDTSPVFVL